MNSLLGLQFRLAKKKEELMSLLQRLKAEGRRVYGYGATAKSATMINYCGITPDLVQGIFDTTKIKQHRLSPGMHLPVLPYEQFSTPYPDYALLFAWNHREEIMAKEEGFWAAGGRWISYTPEVTIF